MLERKRKKEERELDGKEERRGTEGERVARKEGKENEVEKDVTGWTEVSRNKRKKMVQIFVKVDEMKTVVMEVSTEDKVQKILNIVSKSDEDVYVTSGGRILKGSDKLKSCEVRDGSTVEVTSRMRDEGKHKDKKGKEEKKQVVQLDDGMCAIACEQLRLPTERMSQGSTEEDRRRIPGDIENVRKAMAVVEEKVKGEDVHRMAELEEGLKKLEEKMRPWSVEEQRRQEKQEEQRRQEKQEEQRRQEEQEEQRRHEEQEHAAMRKGKGKGNGGKGEHASRKRKFRGKGAVKMVNGDDEGEEADEEKGGTRKLRWADCEEEAGARQGVARGRVA